MSTGDDGTTSGGIRGRMSKDDIRIEAIGELDELSCRLGHARLAADPAARESLEAIQIELHDIGALLMGYPAAVDLAASVSRMEAQIAKLESAAPLNGFVLPASTEGSARLDLARCSARRLERLLTAVSHAEALPPGVGAWINRLGKYLFRLARRAEGAELRFVPKRGS